MRAITPDKPTTLIDVLFGLVSGTIKGGGTGPEGFTLLLRLLMTHFDRVDTGKGYTKLPNFGACTGTPFCDISREFRVLVEIVTRNERLLAPGVDVDVCSVMCVGCFLP